MALLEQMIVQNVLMVTMDIQSANLVICVITMGLNWLMDYLNVNFFKARLEFRNVNAKKIMMETYVINAKKEKIVNVSPQILQHTPDIVQCTDLFAQIPFKVFGPNANKQGKIELVYCYLLDVVGSSQIFFPTQNLARAY